jgi:hypothetical protein
MQVTLWNFEVFLAAKLCNWLGWPIIRAAQPIANHLSTSYSQLMLMVVRRSMDLSRGPLKLLCENNSFKKIGRIFETQGDFFPSPAG